MIELEGMGLIDELRELADLTPPICMYEEGNPGPVYCKPFEQFQEVLRAAADALSGHVYYAGGCYCRECEYLTETPWPGSRVYECTWAHQSTTLDDWCSHGRRADF